MLKKIMQKRWFWPAFAGLLLLIWLLSAQNGDGSRSEPVWSDLRLSDFSIDAVETGEVEAVHSVDLSPPMEWRMDMQIIAMVPEGTVVKEGDFLVQFDTSELEDRLELAQNTLTSLLAQRDGLRAEQSARISQLKANIAAATYSEEIAVLQRELLKYEAAVKRMDAELEEKKARISHIEAQTNLESQEVIHASALSTLRVEIEKSRGEVRELEEKIGNLTLRAPIGGLVVYQEIESGGERKKIAVGDKPRPGEPVISIPNLDTMQVKLRVNEMDAARLSIDQSARISLEAYPGRSFDGQVARIAKLAQKQDFDSEIKDFEVIVRMSQADSVLKPGMTARVQIALGLEQNVLTAPTGAIFERGGERVVFPKKGYPEPLAVETGSRSDQRIVVVSTELKPGELLSLTAPDSGWHRMGYAAYAAASLWRGQNLSAAFAEMERRGLTYDYDGNRNRRVIARAPTGAAGDFEGVQGRIPGMPGNGRPMEIDPARMKQLEEAMRGMQPGPGAPAGISPGDTSMVRRMRQGRRPGGQGFPGGFTPGDTSGMRRMRPGRWPGGQGFPAGAAPGDSSRARRRMTPPTGAENRRTPGGEGFIQGAPDGSRPGR